MRPGILGLTMRLEIFVAPALPALYDKMGSPFARSGFGFFHNGATTVFEASRTRAFLAVVWDSNLDGVLRTGNAQLTVKGSPG